MQARMSVSQAAQAGGMWTSSISWPNRCDQRWDMATGSETSYPHQVPSLSLIALAKPASTKKTSSSDTRATGFHFTQAEMASEIREIARIQIQLPARIAHADPRILAQPARPLRGSPGKRRAAGPGPR